MSAAKGSVRPHTPPIPPEAYPSTPGTVTGRTDAAPVQVDGAQTSTVPNVYTCHIPMLPPSLNEYTRMHWAVKKRTREAFQWEVWAAINGANGQGRCPRGLEAVDLRAVLTFSVKRGRDSDNYGACLWKFVQDVLTRQGVIPDDTADRCTGYPPRIEAGELVGTLLMITERRQQ